MKHTTITSLAIVALGSLVLATAGQAAPTRPPSIEIKIDLAIPATGLTITKTGVAGTSHRVRIDTTVIATAGRDVCSGPFKIKLESTENPTSGHWALVGESGIADLCVRGGGATIPSAKRFFTDTVPAGTARKYRLTVDFMNRVDEMNEGNNVASAGYVAR